MDQGGVPPEPAPAVESTKAKLPLPPIFGNAKSAAEGGPRADESNALANMNLEDVFSGIFFTPDGNLLDIPSDEEDLLTLSSISGKERTPFGVLSKRPLGTEADEANTALSQTAKAAAAAAAEAAEAQAKAYSKANAAAQAAAAHARAQAEAMGIKGGAWSAGMTSVAGVASGVGLAAVKTELGSERVGIGGRLGTTAGTIGRWAGVGAGQTGSVAGVAAGAVGRRDAEAHPPPKRLRQKISSKDLTEEQRVERRERNREHAKRSRVRKKFLLDSLQRSVDALQAENDSLKGSIVDHLGEKGEVLIAKYTPGTSSLVTASPQCATKILDDPDYSLVKALQTARQNFVITDASLPNNPIVFASSGFLTLTGYGLRDVLGRNCRFLQGPETDPRAVDKIRTAILEGSDASVCLLNYREDGTTFWNQFFVAALRDGEGNIVNYVGVQCKVGDEYAKIVVTEQNRIMSSEQPSAKGAGIGGGRGGESAAAGGKQVA